MKVQVSVEVFSGTIHEVKAFDSPEKAEKHWRDFLKEYYNGSHDSYKEALEHALPKNEMSLFEVEVE